MDKTVTEMATYTAIKLAELRLPGFPASRKNWYELVAREQWQVVEKPGKGPGGLRREYIPPPEVQAMIDAVLRGETPPARERRKQGGARVEQRPSTASNLCMPTRGSDIAKSFNQQKFARLPGAVDYLLLRRCLAACSMVYGANYDRTPMANQLKFATDFYNTLISMAVHMKGGVGAFQQLEVTALVEQLRLLLQMTVLKPWSDICAPVDSLEVIVDSCNMEN